MALIRVLLCKENEETNYHQIVSRPFAKQAWLDVEGITC